VPDAITVSTGGKFRTGAATTTTSIHVNRGMTIGAGGGGLDTPIDAVAGVLTTIWNGPITGNQGGDLIMVGAGIVRLTNTNNNYDGNTVISAGALRVNNSGVIPDTSIVNVTGGTFDMATDSTSETVKSIAGATAGTIALGVGSILTLNDPNGETAAQTLNVPSTGKIIKNGSGALTLAGGASNNNASTGFNGEFVLNSGTLGIGTSTMLGGNNTPTATFTINGGRLSNTDASDKNFNSALITNLNGDFQVGTNLFATPGVIRFNGGTQTIRNSNRTITVNGLANLQFAGVVAEDVPGRSLTKEGTGILQLTNLANTYTGGTIVNAGTLAVGRLHENNAVTINAGLLKVFDSSPTFPNHPEGNNASLSQPKQLTINGTGTLDLGNNDMVIAYGASTPYAGVSPAAALEDLIAQGFNGGDWLGTGITSSAAASGDAAGNFVLAIVDNAALPQPYGASNGGDNFSGVDVPLESVLVKFTHRVDLNLDGLVTDADAIIFSTNYEAGAAANWGIGDLDYDGTFTDNDAIIFGTFYDPGLAHLPEPGAIGVFALLGVLASRRARRRLDN
jgi:autotransporter-associated beta strand protein